MDLFVNGLVLGGLVGILLEVLGGLVGILLGGLEGVGLEQGLEAVTKEEAGSQGSVCLIIYHGEENTLNSNRRRYADRMRNPH